ncbi:MAG: M1 family metallopeptidase [Candidatus Marinimicrobia bacterium]|nr:M1 family metallopeptidase [Candidatus Neomarinimicrobiota bacterium]
MTDFPSACATLARRVYWRACRVATIYTTVLFTVLIIGGQACHRTTLTDATNFDDPHSFSRPWEARVTELALDLTVDFERHIVHGSAAWDVEVAPGATQLVLDINNLNIERVVLQPGDSEATYSIGRVEPYLGQPLTIDLQPRTKTVVVYYSTRPGYSALDWLEPAQTAGGRHPFLYTQSEPVLARSFFPCQDTPGVRFPYRATITVPAGLLALMSAENPQAKSDDGVYQFNMPQPIPSYLVALAVGDLEFQSLGPRTGVYAEPQVIEKAAYEFAETEAMLAAAEALYGDYQWGRYDLLVLPPSFPMGGMENPRLTFATPTILAGDRSLTALIAHELAHSWSGNLVTNASWEDLWLNEGFTTYFESRIMEAVYGHEYEQMLTTLALGELHEELDRYGWDHPDSRLKLDLIGRDPDSSFNSMAYDKGRFFLLNLEQQLGRERWDKFLAGYFDAFAFQSMSTDGFLEYLDAHLIQGDPVLAESLNVAGWVYSPGLPARFPHFDSPMLEAIGQQAAQFATGLPAAQLDTTGWTTHHWLQFLRELPDDIGAHRLGQLDSRFQLTHTGNAEIKFDWLRLSIRNQYSEAYPTLDEFLSTVGRLKFLIPLYRALQATPEGQARAARIYAGARPGYHSTAWKILDPLVGYKPAGDR